MMRKKMQLITPVLGLALGLSGMLSNAVQASIIENAVDTAGLTGFIDIAYGDYTVNSGLVTNIEVDSYRFFGEAGDSIRLVLSTTTGGLDPQIALRDSSGTVLNTSTCNGNNVFGSGIRCTSVLDQVLSTTGSYFLNITDSGANETGNYEMGLDINPPVNNWNGFAYDSPLDESLGQLVDTDFLAFNGEAGTGVRLTLASLTGGLDPNMRIWDPLGNLIDTASCNGNNVFGSGILCAFASELNLTETGIYKIGLNDSGWNEIGNYRLGVSCLYGTCPSAAPSAVPLPPALWLFGSGLLGLGAIIRRRS